MKSFNCFVRCLAFLLAVPAAPIVAQNQAPREQRGIFGAGQPGEVSVVRLEARKMGMKNFEMNSRSVDGRLAIDGFTSNLGSGTMTGTGLVDWSRPNDIQRMQIQFSGVEAAALLKAFEVKLDAQIHATASGTIDVQWQGVRGSQPRQTMNGTVNIQLGPGVISNADALNQAAQITGIAELQRFDFSGAQLQGNIRSGLMSITDATVAGPYQQAIGKGALDLRSEEVRIKFDVFMVPELAQRSTVPQIRTAGAIVSKVRDKSAGNQIQIPLPVAMVGRIRDPQFVFDTATGTGI